MADNDVFYRSQGGWCKASYKAARGIGSASEVAERIGVDICRLIRPNGCSGFEERCNILDSVCAPDGQLAFSVGDYEAISKQCRDISKQCADNGALSLITDLEDRAAQDILFESQLTGPINGNVEQVFAGRFLLELANFAASQLTNAPKVFERFLTENNGDRARAIESMLDFCSEVQSHLPEVLAPLTQKLSSDPSGQKMRTRSKKTPQRQTAELVSITV